MAEFTQASPVLDNELLLNSALESASMGYYSTDIIAGTWTNNKLFDDIFGINADFVRNLDSWEKIIHPDDKRRVFSFFEKSIEEKELFLSLIHI